MANHRPVARRAHIVGWGMAVPERVLTNEDLAAMVDTSDGWIRQRTGIADALAGLAARDLGRRRVGQVGTMAQTCPSPPTTLLNRRVK